MKVTTEANRGVDEQALFDALDALQPSQQDLQKRAFEKAYPRILNKIAEGIKEGDIIKALAEQGILKSRNTYTKWMAEIKESQAAGIKETSAVQDAMRRGSGGHQI